MPNAYDGYCYATALDAANAELSHPIMASGGLYSPVSVAVSGANATFTYQYASPGQTTVSLTATRAYPDCASAGPLHNLSGLELNDVVSVSMSIVLIWSIAFCSKALQKGAEIK